MDVPPALACSAGVAIAVTVAGQLPVFHWPLQPIPTTLKHVLQLARRTFRDPVNPSYESPYCEGCQIRALRATCQLGEN